MYSLLRTPHPPTGVEHAIEAHFFGPWERNLLVAGANMLRVFRLVPDLSQNTDKNNTAVINEQTGEVTVNGKHVKMRLECVASYSLFGEIMDLQKVRKLINLLINLSLAITQNRTFRLVAHIYFCILYRLLLIRQDETHFYYHFPMRN